MSFWNNEKQRMEFFGPPQYRRLLEQAQERLITDPKMNTNENLRARTSRRIRIAQVLLGDIPNRNAGKG